MKTVKIKPESKVKALQALYNRAEPQGMGILQAQAGPLSDEDAQEHLQPNGRGEIYVDYCKGRPIKVNFTTDELDLRLFDRDAGSGAGQTALLNADLVLDKTKAEG